MLKKNEEQTKRHIEIVYTTKAQLRSGRRRTDEVPDLTEAPEQPEDILFNLAIVNELFGTEEGTS